MAPFVIIPALGIHKPRAEHAAWIGAPPLLVRRPGVFEFQPVGVDKEHGVVALSAVALRLVGRCVEDSGSDLLQHFVEPVDVAAGLGPPRKMMQAW